MNQQQSWLISVVVLYLTLALSLGCVHAQVPAHVKKGIVDIPGSKGGNKGIERELIIGTGNISISVVTRTEEPLNPPCVVLVTRILDLTYTGIIQTLPKESAEASSVTHDAADRVVVNRCVDTPEGAFSRIDTLAAVMMAGRKGGLVIEVNGTFVGDVRSPAGVRNVAHLTIRGVTGELKGIRGRGLFVGRTSLTEGFNTYWVELQFDDDDF